jgi:hypothetical protein
LESKGKRTAGLCVIFIYSFFLRPELGSFAFFSFHHHHREMDGWAALEYEYCPNEIPFNKNVGIGISLFSTGGCLGWFDDLCLGSMLQACG